MFWIFAAIAITAAGFLVWWLLRKKRPANAPEVKVEKYGFEHAPIPVIRRHLVDLPYPYTWESWIDRSSGDDVFHVRLISLEDDAGEAKKSWKVNLTAAARRNAELAGNEFWARGNWNDWIRPMNNKIDAVARGIIHAGDDRVDYQFGGRR